MIRFYTAIIFFFFIHNFYSQNLPRLFISGKSEILKDELIDHTKKTSNGEVCAGLMIVSDIPGLNYEPNNGYVDIKRKVNSDLLYLSSDEQIVKIRCQGYDILKIILNDEGIKLHSGEVWQIKITGDKKSDIIPINIITNPKGAEIYIDNVPKGTGTTFGVSAGEHNLQIELNGFETHAAKIIVTTNNTLFNYNLTAIKQEVIEIRSVPTGATIYFDGVQEGETDNQLFRFPGKYKIRLTKSGYLDVEKEIEVKKNGENKFSFNLVKNISSLILSVTPDDAEIEINNKSYGKTRNIELAPGTHSLVIKKQGYREYHENISLTLNTPLKITTTLVAITGSLQVKVLPIDAEVKLLKDGKEIDKWKGAKLIDSLIIGEYKLESKFTGYENFSKNIKIGEGKTGKEEIIMIEGKGVLDDSNYSIINTENIIYEGKTYHTIKIGPQIWLKENLDIGTRINGNLNQKNNYKIEKYCYDDKINNCEKYGGLYQWNEAMQYDYKEKAKGICPNGWHVPSKSEFETLIKMSKNNSNNLKVIRNGSENGSGTYSSNFSALLSGFRTNIGSFSNLNSYSDFWTSKDFDNNYSYELCLNSYNTEILISNSNKNNAFSVRCIKN